MPLIVQITLTQALFSLFAPLSHGLPSSSPQTHSCRAGSSPAEFVRSLLTAVAKAESVWALAGISSSRPVPKPEVVSETAKSLIRVRSLLSSISLA